MSARPVDVVVVTFNSERVITTLLESLPDGLRDLDWRALLVDNGSADQTVEVARGSLPAVTVEALGGNRGFAAAVNRGLGLARRGSDVLILNPDVEVAPGAGRGLQSLLGKPGPQDAVGHARASRIGIAAPRTLSAAGELTPSLRREPSIRRALAEAMLGSRPAGRRGWGEAILDPVAYERATTADWASGAALMISRECLDSCGAWDESFFLYSEDAEYCLRARDRGFLTALAPEAVVRHYGGESRTDARLWTLLVRNKVELYRRRHGRARSLGFRVAALLRELRLAATGNRPSLAAARGLLTIGAPR